MTRLFPRRVGGVGLGADYTHHLMEGICVAEPGEEVGHNTNLRGGGGHSSSYDGWYDTPSNTDEYSSFDLKEYFILDTTVLNHNTHHECSGHKSIVCKEVCNLDSARSPSSWGSRQ